MQALHCQPNRLTSFTQPGEETRRAEGQFWGNTYLSTPHLSDHLRATVAAFPPFFLQRRRSRTICWGTVSHVTQLFWQLAHVFAQQMLRLYIRRRDKVRLAAESWRHPAPLTQVLPWFVTRFSKTHRRSLRSKRGRSAYENKPARAVWETAALSLHCYRTASSLKRLF